MVRLYADEDVHEALVLALRRLGYDVLTTREAGRSNQGTSDRDQLAYAAAHDRALLTHNRRHFRRLHRATATHAGIVAITQSTHFAREADRLHERIAALDSLTGQFVTLDLPQ